MAKKHKRKKPNTPQTRWGIGPAAGAFRHRIIPDKKKKENKNHARKRVDPESTDA